MRRRAVAWTVGLAALACRGDGRTERQGAQADTLTFVPPSPPPAPPPARVATDADVPAGAGAGAGAGGACPHDGRWRACSVAERLEQAGLVPRPDTARRSPVPFLSAPDTSLRVALGSVRAFVYADTARLARDLATVDPLRVAPRGNSFDWPVRPTLVRSANLVAVVLVTNERQLERVQLALEAGPPQRNPDRP